MKKKHLYLAAVYASLAALSNTLMAALIKIEVAKGFAPPLLIFWRSLIGLLFILPVLAWMPPSLPFLDKIKTQHYGLLLIRGLTGLVSFYLFFYSLKLLSLANATLLFFTFPLFMPFVGWFWKRIPLPKWEWVGLFIGFVGVLLVIRPDYQLFRSAAILSLFAGAIYSIGQFAVHLLARTDSYRSINFYYFLILCISSLPLSFIDMGKGWEALRGIDYLICIAIGIFGLFYLVLLNYALKMGPPNPITACLYLTVIFSMGLDWLVWKKVEHWLSAVGAILIFLGVLVKLHFHKFD